MTVSDPEWRAPSEPPTPVTPVPFGKPWSIWFWGGLLSTGGLALAVAPRQVLDLLNTSVETPSLPWVRFAGLVLPAGPGSAPICGPRWCCGCSRWW
jgi:hypothetical protein